MNLASNTSIVNEGPTRIENARLTRLEESIKVIPDNGAFT